MTGLHIFAAGLVTYAIRLSFVAVHGRVALPRWFTRALAFAPAAVLSAIVVPDLLIPQPTLESFPANARRVAGLAAALVAWRTHNAWATIAAGLGVLWLLQTIR